MIWADRLALGWAALLIFVMTLAWKGPGFPLDDGGVWYILELIVGIPWLVLRVLDFIFTGQIRLGSLGHLGRATRQRPDIVVMPPYRGRR